MKRFTVIVCGSRDWTDGEMILRELGRIASREINPLVIHGGARGADTLAVAACRRLGLEFRGELADWVGRGRAAGPERNRRMLELGPSLVLAFKDGLDSSLRTGGTENMVKIARAAGVEVRLFDHDKEVSG